MSEDGIISSSNDISPGHPSVVYGYKTCQTREARWLYLEDIYQKFFRPSTYDLGGTYIVDVADFWFQYSTHQVADLFLLHLFVIHKDNCDNPYVVSVGTSNTMEFGKKSQNVILQCHLKEFKCPNKLSYLTTYSFKEVDIEFIKDKHFYIPVLFDQGGCNQDIVENVKFKHDFGYLLKDPVGSDFTIEVEGHKFKVHQALLAESSEVFKAMFKDEMAEGKTGYLNLIDVSKEDFQAVLEFIYTGTIDNIESCNVLNILQLADRYNLQSLHELCQYVLAQHLTIDNTLAILVYADIYNASYLKHATMKMIKTNKSIIKSKEFKEIKNADLAREICEYLVLGD